METTNNGKDFIFYTNNSPNTFKINLIFNELKKSHGVNFETVLVNIVEKENFSDKFLKLNPNAKVPIIIDQTLEKPLVIFESVSILIYLAQKYNIFLPDQKIDPRGNSNVITWTVWQAANLGPGMGQLNHFTLFAPKAEEYSLHRFNDEVQRIFRLLDSRLADNDYIAGNEYSIADIATLGWTLAFVLFDNNIYGATKQRYPNIFKWLDLVNKRDAVKKTNITVINAIKSFDKNKFRSLFTSDPNIISLNAPLGFEKVFLKYD